MRLKRRAGLATLAVYCIWQVLLFDWVLSFIKSCPCIDIYPRLDIPLWLFLTMRQDLAMKQLVTNHWWPEVNYAFSTFASGWNWEFSCQNNWIARGLFGNFSGPVSAADPVKSSKDAASLLVCTRKKIVCLREGGFLWVTS